jgi:hypothetical protein
VEVIAKFKCDDHNTTDHRVRVAKNLTARAERHDQGAAGQLLRRLAERGEWTTT